MNAKWMVSLAHYRSLVTIACLLVFSGFSYAHENVSNSSKERDSLYIRLGSYFVWHSETKMNITSPFLLGATLDVNSDLNMDDPGYIGRIDAYYRIKRKHAIGFSFYSLNQSGSTTAGREITIPDPADPTRPVTIPVGADVQSQLSSDIYRLNYIWSFYRSNQTEMALNLGLHVTRLEASIRGELIAGDPLSINETAVDVTAPLPVIGARISYKPTNKSRISFENNIFLLSYDKYRGSYIDTSVFLEYQLFKKVGIGGGVNFNSLDLVAEDTDNNRILDLQHGIGALQLYLYYRY
jgi:hypothetical protein